MLRQAIPGVLVLAFAVMAPPVLAGDSPSVARSAFTVGVQDREPVNRIEAVGPEHEQVYYFTELSNLQGHTVSHRWEHDGQVMAEVHFSVGGPRWRVYSSKRLIPGTEGDWVVSVVDDDGRILKQERLRYLTAEDL